MKRIYSKPLKKGDTIGVAALTWKPDPSKIYESEAILNSLGFEVDVHENCSLEDGQMAGTEAQRLQAFNELLKDDLVDGIIFARGGYGSPQLLGMLDYDLIKKTRKHIQGYSDPTAILNAIYAQTGLVTYHGPMAGTNNVQFADSATQNSFMDVASGDAEEILLKPCRLVTSGKAEGTLIGGNATAMIQLMGTPYFPQDKNLILVFEDVCQEINDVDKYFYHFKNAGIAHRIKGLILGNLDALNDNLEPFGYTAAEIVKKHFPKVPCLLNVNCGHEETILTFPIGAKVRFEANDMHPKLVLLDE